MARKDVENFIYKMMDRLTGTPRNKEMYMTLFGNMSDKKFDTWIKNVHSGKSRLSVTIPNNAKETADVATITKMAKEIGYDMFDYIIYDKGDEIRQSPVKACILDVPCRRMAQLVDKNISVTTNDSSTDKITGQAVGGSAAASLSAVETDVLISSGVKDGAREMMKSRGGDVGAYKAFKSIMLASGEVNLSEAERYSTGVSSLKTMSIYLKCKMIGNNL